MKTLEKDKKWFDQLQDIGCIVCYNEGHPGVPADIHHIHKNSRRVDHFHSIPLCFNHHREGSKNDRWVSRHPWKKEFEKNFENFDIAKFRSFF